MGTGSSSGLKESINYSTLLVETEMDLQDSTRSHKYGNGEKLNVPMSEISKLLFCFIVFIFRTDAGNFVSRDS